MNEGLLSKHYPTLERSLRQAIDWRMDVKPDGYCCISLAPEPSIVVVHGTVGTANAMSVHTYETGECIYELVHGNGEYREAFPAARNAAAKAFAAEIPSLLGPTGIIALVERSAASDGIRLPASLYSSMSPR